MAEKLDLLIGTLSEGYRPTGFGFGETMFQIFILNATRRLQADRFYTDTYNEETYTKEGLDWIDNSTLRSVLLGNYPELAHTGLANVTNAFEPWDTEQRLDPKRHPLRGFEKELKPDPWLGGCLQVNLVRLNLKLPLWTERQACRIVVASAISHAGLPRIHYLDGYVGNF